DTNSNTGSDLLTYLRYNADEPSGALQLGVFHLDRGDLNQALGLFRRAVQWDTNSAPLHHALAIGLSLEGDRKSTRLNSSHQIISYAVFCLKKKKKKKKKSKKIKKNNRNMKTKNTKKKRAKVI